MLFKRDVAILNGYNLEVDTNGEKNILQSTRKWEKYCIAINPVSYILLFIGKL